MDHVFFEVHWDIPGQVRKFSESTEGKEYKAAYSEEDVENLIKMGMYKGVCKNVISDDYVWDHYDQNVIKIVMTYEPPNGKRDVLGFLVGGGSKKNKHVYVDVICAKKWGGALLKYFLKLASSMGYREINLTSLEYVIAFYQKQGFEFRHSCKKPAKARIPDNLVDYIQTQQKKGFLLSVDSIYEDNHFMDFIMKIHKLGFTKASDRMCLYPDISKEEFIDGDCGHEGFRMTYCPPPRTQTRKHSISHKKTLRKQRKERKERIQRIQHNEN